MSGIDDATLRKPAIGMPYYLPLAYVPLTIQGAPPAGTGKPYTLTPTFGSQLTYLPDATQAYFLSANHEALSDDHFTIKTDQNGLLQTVSLQATDQSGQVLVQLAQLAAQIATAPTALGGVALPKFAQIAPPAPPAPKPCSLPAYQWSGSLDPTAGKPAVPPIQGGNGEAVSFDVSYSSGAPANETNAPAPTTVEGIYFRTPVPYTITITATPTPAAVVDCMLPGAVTQSVVTALPNGGRIFAADVSRALWVQRTVNLTVQNGMLTSVDDTHPSEVYGLSQIPTKILSPILSIPSNLLTLHIQQLQSEGQLTAAEATLLQNQLSIVNNQAALTKALQNGTAAGK